jgi:MOSC domain-containing protein YiiM
MSVELICTARDSGGALEKREAARIVAGAGIEGDRYFGAEQQYPGQNITLIEAEEIERFNHDNNASIGLLDTRRNIVTRGVRLAPLVGKEFTIGTVRFRGVELCEPCAVLGTGLASAGLPAATVVRQFVHKAGLRADALSSGTIRIGDPLVEHA